MRILVPILAAALSAPLLAQPPRLPANMEKLTRSAKETAEVTLDGPLLKLAARFLSDKDSDQARARKALEGIDGIYVRSFEFDHDTVYDEADLNELRSQYRAPEWSRIVGVRGITSGDNADIFFKVTANGLLNGITILAAGRRELTIVSISGNIDPAQFVDLGGQFHIPKLDLSPKQFRRMEP
ncbi:MAG TPA: DUF4252 domain-containing protein [Candidatus Sulfopaludibacter sp.]|jgi:hypothetical protein|nr:DUF4252 domain-containing protein [Candidatus Sulfopaludibacter sp.]